MGAEPDPRGIVTESRGEVQMLREELRLCRLELAQVREENEAVREKQARLRRARARAQRESTILAKALVDVLYRETRRRARAAWWQRGRGDVTPEEWRQIQVLRQSGLFRPVWYLRRNLTVAKLAVDPALHFLRDGHSQGRDPGPDFDLLGYLDTHPELRESGENALLHALEVGDAPEPRSGPAAPA
ncbi:hypothetical protein KRR39_17350 [Nocardioides panacis]|uniref:Uncharacterized protein n=1 Tax=Nocardioides panacis TaxID=2849501 RepID=A0A975SXT6_9ACTN|nr:hypothetical protein [Nocardioides panacis]QWZ07224.1 hypothetical protein KRR39_17350 [Nocardioides panacis]